MLSPVHLATVAVGVVAAGGAWSVVQVARGAWRLATPGGMRVRPAPHPG